MRGWLQFSSIVLVLSALMGNRHVVGLESPRETGSAGGPDLMQIKPGTIVENQAPYSWTHLVVKSLPRLASGDLQTLPRSAFRMAALIRTVILADVGRSVEDPEVFVLRRIGVGLCVPDKHGRDVVVHSDQLEGSGVDLGLVERIVLEKAEAELARGRLLAATPTFALYRGPVAMPGENGHHKVLLSYAFLVRPHNGALRTFVWSTLAQPDGTERSMQVVELKPNLVFDCPLNVQADRLLGTVPVSWSLAMESLPPGQSRTVPAPLSRLLTMPHAGASNSAMVEQTVRRVLKASSAVTVPIPSAP